MKIKSDSVSFHQKKISSRPDPDPGQNWIRTGNPGPCSQPMLDSAVKFMLEYKIHQNSDPEQIKYLCKLLADKEKAAAASQAQHSELQTAASEASKPRRGCRRSRKNAC